MQAIPLVAALGTANIWLAQPLLPTIGADLNASVTSMTIAFAAGQWAYAAGQVTVSIAARHYSIRQVLLSIAALLAMANLAAAFTRDYWALAVVLIAIGALAAGAPLLLAVATQAAPARERASVAGRVIGGLLLGGAIARLASGSVGGLLGWRIVFALAAMLAVASLIGIALSIPPQRRLAASANTPAQLFTRARILLFMCNAGLFAASGIVWAFMPYLLSGPPYRLPPSAIGFVGGASLAGAAAAFRGGSLVDRYGSAAIARTAAIGVIVASLLLAAGTGTLLLMLAGLILLELVVGGAQPAILSFNNNLDLPLRGTANAMSSVFAMSGGFVGVLVGGWFFAVGGWSASCLVAGAFALGSLVLAASTARQMRDLTASGA